MSRFDINFIPILLMTCYLSIKQQQRFEEVFQPQELTKFGDEYSFHFLQFLPIIRVLAVGTIQGHHITTPHATKHHIAILTKNNDFTMFWRVYGDASPSEDPSSIDLRQLNLA
jgi:hypothetical protein